jgi:murein DD-endopeptidase MepM/ murein hydrolase activator NlpD
MRQLEVYERPGLPTTRYFVSISRGDSIRTATLAPAALWALLALAPLSVGFGAAGALELACGAHLGDAIDLRAAESDPRDRADEAERSRLAEADALEARISGVVARQARMEKRSAAVVALAGQARDAALIAHPIDADALRAIESFGPRSPGAGRPFGPADLGGVRAYAPSAPAPPHASLDPLGASSRAPAPSFAALAANPDLDAGTRLAFVDRSLDRIEAGQMAALAAVDRAAAGAADRDAAILADAGLDAKKLADRKPSLPMGGPFEPLDTGPSASAFDRAAARAAHDVELAEKLRALMAYVPLGKPLAGDMAVASPFGYRIDPFLGRPALHAGVDLLQAYGAEIRAAGAGRVVHAGPMGGYGVMVEIDHGTGLATRYAHLSEVLVDEGEEVDKGAVVGRLGSTGRATGPHLHYEVRIDGEPVDPERFLRAGERLAVAE